MLENKITALNEQCYHNASDTSRLPGKQGREQSSPVISSPGYRGEGNSPCHPSAWLSHVGDVGTVTRRPFLSAEGRCKAYWRGDAARELLQGITDP